MATYLQRNEEISHLLSGLGVLESLQQLMERTQPKYDYVKKVPEDQQYRHLRSIEKDLIRRGRATTFKRFFGLPSSYVVKREDKVLYRKIVFGMNKVGIPYGTLRHGILLNEAFWRDARRESYLLEEEDINNERYQILRELYLTTNELEKKENALREMQPHQESLDLKGGSSPVIEYPKDFDLEENYKGLFMEFCQANKMAVPVYTHVEKIMNKGKVYQSKMTFSLDGKTYEKVSSFWMTNKIKGDHFVSFLSLFMLKNMKKEIVENEKILLRCVDESTGFRKKDKARKDQLHEIRLEAFLVDNGIKDVYLRTYLEKGHIFCKMSIGNFLGSASGNTKEDAEKNVIIKFCIFFHKLKMEKKSLLQYEFVKLCLEEKYTVTYVRGGKKHKNYFQANLENNKSECLVFGELRPNKDLAREDVYMRFISEILFENFSPVENHLQNYRKEVFKRCNIDLKGEKFFKKHSDFLGSLLNTQKVFVHDLYGVGKENSVFDRVLYNVSSTDHFSSKFSSSFFDFNGKFLQAYDNRKNLVQFFDDSSFLDEDNPFFDDSHVGTYYDRLVSQIQFRIKNDVCYSIRKDEDRYRVVVPCNEERGDCYVDDVDDELLF